MPRRVSPRRPPTNRSAGEFRRPATNTGRLPPPRCRPRPPSLPPGASQSGPARYGPVRSGPVRPGATQCVLSTPCHGAAQGGATPRDGMLCPGSGASAALAHDTHTRRTPHPHAPDTPTQTPTHTPIHTPGVSPRSSAGGTGCSGEHREPVRWTADSLGRCGVCGGGAGPVGVLTAANHPIDKHPDCGAEWRHKDHQAGGADCVEIKQPT